MSSSKTFREPCFATGGTRLKELRDLNIPLLFSLLHRPSTEGRGRARPCGRLVLEAVIEKRKTSAKRVHQAFFRL